jgi:hypothetical protein
MIRTPDKIKGLEAILYMISELRKVAARPPFLACEKIAVEFPAAFYNPKFSSGALTPLAAISGACMCLFQDKTEKKVLPVYPSTWNGGKRKEQVAVLVGELIGTPDEWEYDNKPTREADFEHIIDAVGIAYWLTEREHFPAAASVGVTWDGKKATTTKSSLQSDKKLKWSKKSSEKKKCKSSFWKNG